MAEEAIYLTTIGPVEDIVLASAEMALWHTFGHAIRRLPEMSEVPDAFNVERRQWNSPRLLQEVTRILPAGALRLLALTERDLFTPMLSFVFGQAQLGGSVAIVSAARLRQEFYELPSSETLFVSRLVKEVIHELGHTFGLVHCTDATCPMSLSTSVRQVDQKGSELCRACLLNLGGKAPGAGPAADPGSEQ